MVLEIPLAMVVGFVLGRIWQILSGPDFGVRGFFFKLLDLVLLLTILQSTNQALGLARK
jgi:hypothetical protein